MALFILKAFFSRLLRVVANALPVVQWRPLHLLVTKCNLFVLPPLLNSASSLQSPIVSCLPLPLCVVVLLSVFASLSVARRRGPLVACLPFNLCRLFFLSLCFCLGIETKQGRLQLGLNCGTCPACVGRSNLGIREGIQPLFRFALQGFLHAKGWLFPLGCARFRRQWPYQSRPPFLPLQYVPQLTSVRRHVGASTLQPPLDFVPSARSGHVRHR